MLLGLNKIHGLEQMMEENKKPAQFHPENGH